MVSNYNLSGGKKLNINQGSQCKKKIGIKAKKFRPEKGQFLGHPVIQAVVAKMLGPFYKKFVF